LGRTKFPCGPHAALVFEPLISTVSDSWLRKD